jgi:hypothetical protein
MRYIQISLGVKEVCSVLAILCSDFLAKKTGTEYYSLRRCAYACVAFQTTGGIAGGQLVMSCVMSVLKQLIKLIIHHRRIFTKIGVMSRQTNIICAKDHDGRMNDSCHHIKNAVAE